MDTLPMELVQTIAFDYDTSVGDVAAMAATCSAWHAFLATDPYGMDLWMAKAGVLFAARRGNIRSAYLALLRTESTFPHDMGGEEKAHQWLDDALGGVLYLAGEANASRNRVSFDHRVGEMVAFVLDELFHLAPNPARAQESLAYHGAANGLVLSILSSPRLSQEVLLDSDALIGAVMGAQIEAVEYILSLPGYVDPRVFVRAMGRAPLTKDTAFLDALLAVVLRGGGVQIPVSTADLYAALAAGLAMCVEENHTDMVGHILNNVPTIEPKPEYNLLLRAVDSGSLDMVALVSSCLDSSRAAAIARAEELGRLDMIQTLSDSL